MIGIVNYGSGNINAFLNVYKKLALVFTVGDSEPSEVFDVADDEVGLDAVQEAARHNIFGEVLKKSKTGQQIKRLKGPGRVESYKQAFNDIIEEYDDFVRTDSIEDKPSLQEVFLGLGLDEDDLTDDNADLIQEHLEELVYDQQYDIIGQAIGHFEDNPAGPTDADYQDLYDQHKYDYIYVSYDEYDENRWYWDAGFSLDVTDIHEDLEDQDLDEVERRDKHVFWKIKQAASRMVYRMSSKYVRTDIVEKDDVEFSKNLVANYSKIW